ncbi:DUF7617 domain-containing protein [Lentzea aerocolonigenes]|uniref:DUF7617 domain-containing protein n=1 Tax=Lentzea aerocolonigenes TaxID=68170 RepID=UPI0004C457BB|nr:hypothetical protein [Lentzea aerocolonigenes]
MIIAFVLGAGSATVTTGAATADVIVPFTQVYDQVVYGDFNIIGNPVTKCPASPSPLTSALCADGAGRMDPDAVNDEYQMAWADTDTSPATFNSSSTGLTIPPGATVDHVRLHWAGNTGLRAGVTAYEGDWDIAADQFLVNGTAVGEPSGAGTGNFFVDGADGQINPNTPNNFSVDAKDFTLPLGTLPVGATSLSLQFNTTGDSYLAQQVAFSVPLPALKVAKEVCTSTTTADCGPGGSGPWAENTLIPAGSTAYWSIRVSRPTTVDIPGATLNDPAEASCATAPFDLTAGVSASFSCSTADVTEGRTNTTIASFTPPGQTAVSTASDSASVKVTNLAVVKEVCAGTGCGAAGAGPRQETSTTPTGSTAHWRITVTNTGDVDLTGITLTDEGAPGCDAEFDLVVGSSASFHCSTANVTGSVKNEATASFEMMGWPEEATTDAVAAVKITDLHVEEEICAALTAVECATGPWVYSATVPWGATAHWRITVTNTGDVDLTGIVLDDPNEASCSAAPFDLAAHTSKTVDCSTTNLTKKTTNAVTAMYVPPGSPPDTAPIITAPADATAMVSDLLVRKDICQSPVAEACTETGSGPWADDHVVERGGTAHWRITVANTGEVDLTGVTLHDDAEPSCSTGGMNLATGTSVSFTCSTSNVTAGMTKPVVGRYVPPGAPATTAPVATPPDDASVRVADLTMRKEVCLTGNASTCDSWGENATVHSGETVRWRVTVVNTGEVDLAEVTVQDLIEPGCAASAFALATGAENVVHCATTGLSAGIVNTATATYVLPGGLSPVATLPDSASADVSPVSTPPTNPPLAVTGDDVWRLAAIGLLLAGLGLILRLFARRRA